MLSLRVVFIGFFFGYAGWALAQDALPSVVITAPRTLAHTTDPGYITGQARVITREDFRGHQQTLADVLADLPEVQVQRRGELGSFSSVSVRGAPSRQTLVFVNGIKVPTAEGDSVNLAQYLLSDIEAIEVYATAPPGQMAQAGIGGAINIITRDTAITTATTVTVHTGSFGTLGLNAQHRFPWQRWRFQMSAHRWTAANDFPYVFDGGTPNNPDNFQTVRRKNAGYLAQGASLGATHIGEQQQWDARFGVNARRKELPTWNNQDINETDYASTQLNSELGWSSHRLLQGALNTSVRLFWQQEKGVLRDTAGAITIGGIQTEDATSAVGMVPVASGAVGDHWLTVAGDIRRETFVLRRVGQTPTSDFVRQSMAWSVSDEWMPWAWDITLLGNVRLQTYADQSDEELTEAESLWGGQLGVRWQWGSDYVLKTNLTRAHRIPSLFERFGNQGTFRGNAGLVPEMADAWDVSLASKLGPVEWDLAHFLRYSRNAIAPVYNSQGIGRYENIGDAWFQGVEWRIDGSWQWHAMDFTLGYSGSLQQSLIESPFLAYQGNQVPGYYPVSWRVFARAQHQKTQFDAEWTTDRGLYFDRANSTQAPDKQALNMAVRQTFSALPERAEHRLEFSVRNALDSVAMDFNRSPLPGRSFYLTYQLTL